MTSSWRAKSDDHYDLLGAVSGDARQTASVEAGRGGIWAVPLLTPLTSQVVSDTSEASAPKRDDFAPFGALKPDRLVVHIV